MNKKYAKNSIVRIALCSSVIICIGQIAQMNSSSVLVIIALWGIVLISGIMKEEDLLPLMLCILPANRLLTYGPISAPTIVMLCALLRKGKFFLRMKRKLFLPSALLLVYSVLTIFGDEPVFFDAVKILVMLFFIYLYIDKDDISYSYSICTLFCSVGCVLTCGIVLAINPTSIVESSRLSVSEGGGNVLGITCAIMTVNLAVMLLHRTIQSRSFVIVLCIILCGIGFLTGSRSFMLAIGIGIVGILLMMLFRLQLSGFIKVIGMLSIVILFAVFLINTNDFLGNYWNSIIYRITKLQSVDVSNGRYELWEQYMEVFEQNPQYLWFGGLAAGNKGIDMVAHNMIIEQVAAYGIVGSLIIVVLYVSVFSTIAYETGSKIQVWSYKVVPMLSLLGVSMVSHTLLGVTQTTMLFICFFALLKRKN